eukprot:scaffold72690_cov63-Phaeocystis_antarctica.AAC.3
MRCASRASCLRACSSCVYTASMCRWRGERGGSGMGGGSGGGGGGASDDARGVDSPPSPSSGPAAARATRFASAAFACAAACAVAPSRARARASASPAASRVVLPLRCSSSRSSSLTSSTPLPSGSHELKTTSISALVRGLGAGLALGLTLGAEKRSRPIARWNSARVTLPSPSVSHSRKRSMTRAPVADSAPRSCSAMLWSESSSMSKPRSTAVPACSHSATAWITSHSAATGRQSCCSLNQIGRELRIALHFDRAHRARLQRFVELRARASAQQPRELLELDAAAAVRVEGVENLVDLLRGGLEAHLAHAVVELRLRDRAAVVVVPLAEQIDHAHRRLAQRVAQLLRHRQVGGLVNSESLQQRRPCLVDPARAQRSPGLAVHLNRARHDARSTA